MSNIDVNVEVDSQTVTIIDVLPTGPRGPKGDPGETGAGEGVAAGGTTGQFLQKASSTDYDTEWDDVAVSDLSDVDLTGLGDGEVLIWDDGTSTWVPGASGSASAISDLTDVDLTGLDDGEVLLWDQGSSTWTPGTAGASAVADLTDVDLTGVTDGHVLVYDNDLMWHATALGISNITGLSSALGALQPLDSDLTAIAELSTTAFGRALLTLADAEAGRQALEAMSGQGIVNVGDTDLYPTVADAVDALVDGNTLYFPPSDTPYVHAAATRLTIPTGCNIIGDGAVLKFTDAAGGLDIPAPIYMIYRGLTIDGDDVSTAPLVIGTGAGGDGSKSNFVNVRIINGGVGPAITIHNLQNSNFIAPRITGSANSTCGMKVDNGTKNLDIFSGHFSSINGPNLWLTTSGGTQRTSKIRMFGCLMELGAAQGGTGEGVRIGDAENILLAGGSIDGDLTNGVIYFLADGNRSGTGAHPGDNVTIRDMQLTTSSGGKYLNVTGGIGKIFIQNLEAPGTATLYQVDHLTPRIYEIGPNAQEPSTRFASGVGQTEDVAISFTYRSGGTDVSIADGGTGASTAATARTNLGLNTYTLHAAAGGNETLAFTPGAHAAHRVELDSGNCNIAFQAATAGVHCHMTVEFVQDATGSRALTFGSEVFWPNGIEPQLDRTANSVEVFEFYTIDGGTTIRGYKHTAAAEVEYVDHGNTGAAEPITFVPKGLQTHRLVLNSSPVTLTFTASESFTDAPSRVRLHIFQDTSGNRAITWPTVTWSTGAAPRLDTTADALTIVEISTNDGTTYYGHQITNVDEAYDADTWNESREFPTKNSIRDKFESIPIAETSSDIVADAVSSPGNLLWTLNINPGSQAFTLTDHMTILSAKYATQEALPACTYNNGSSGVGATLTADTQTSQAWTRSGTTITITNTGHLMSKGNVVQISASSDTAALPNGNYTIDTVTATNTFTITGINAGGASGTATLILQFNPDAINPALDDVVLVKNQATKAQNGVYKLTTLGTGATASVLTRLDSADEAADFADGITVMVSHGPVNGGANFYTKGTVTLGTTSIIWNGQGKALPTLSDLYFGIERDGRRLFSDFEEQTTTISTSTDFIPGTGIWISLTGAGAQATQQSGDNGGSIGVISLETGSTNAGAAGFSLSRTGGTTSASTPLRWGARMRTPSVSNGAGDDFNCWFGYLAYIIGTNPTSAIGFKLPAGGGTIQCITRDSGTETATDTGVPQATQYRHYSLIYDPMTATVYFYLQVFGSMAKVAEHTTNIPATLLQIGALIDKTASTGSSSLRCDYMGGIIPESRGSIGMMF